MKKSHLFDFMHCCHVSPIKPKMVKGENLPIYKFLRRKKYLVLRKGYVVPFSDEWDKKLLNDLF